MQSDSMSDGQDISLQGAYRQDQGAKLEVKQTSLVVKYSFRIVAPFVVGGIAWLGSTLADLYSEYSSNDGYY